MTHYHLTRGGLKIYSTNDIHQIYLIKEMLVLTKLEITIMYCYETVILPSLDVTSPNVMLSTQCLPAYSLVLGGGRNTVLDRDPPSFY